MRLAQLFLRGDPVISFEFFPPKTDAGSRSLLRTFLDIKTCPLIIVRRHKDKPSNGSILQLPLDPIQAETS